MIKTNFEFPRGDNLEKQGQRLSQDLSLSMRSIIKRFENLENVTTSSSDTYGLDGQIFNVSYSLSAALGSPSSTSINPETATLNHTLGSVPSGFIILDSTFTTSAPLYCCVQSITRSSWTISTVTIKINIMYSTSVSSYSGTMKILVLR